MFSGKGLATMSRTVVSLAALACIILVANPAGSKAELAYIGSATMSADGTITLHLDRTSDGHFLNGTFTYKVDDPDYQKTLAHIGGLKPGETKPVKPWPDQ
jgi:hypothetical protein